MNRIKSLLVGSFVIVSALCQTPLYAQTVRDSAVTSRSGTGVGPGGDDNCNEFYAIASEISLALRSDFSQEQVNQVNRQISIDQLRSVMRHLSVIPVKDLDRTARSHCDDSGKCQTTLDVIKWSAIKNQSNSKERKYKLAAHELMVMTAAEADGEYGISEDLFRIAMRSRHLLNLKAESFIINSDGSISFSFPKAGGAKIDENSNPDGVCISLGLKRSVARPKTVVMGRCAPGVDDTSFGFGDLEYTLEIDSSGHVLGEGKTHGPKLGSYIKNIGTFNNCTKEFKYVISSIVCE